MRPGTPVALVQSKSKLQGLAFEEQLVPNPILCVGLTVEGGALNVDVHVLRIEVDISYGRSSPSDSIGIAHTLKERRCDKVDILPGNRK